jgi:hypothetical protein
MFKDRTAISLKLGVHVVDRAIYGAWKIHSLIYIKHVQENNGGPIAGAWLFQGGLFALMQARFLRQKNTP